MLRRRIIWLLGCNTTRLPSDSSPFRSMVEIIACETSTSHDIAVKLSAVQVISAIVGDFEDTAEYCIPHAESIISSLYQLANECTELESQSLVLGVIPIILSYITGTGRDITASVANISVIPLPSIWDSASGERARLRENVLSILAMLTSSIGPAAVERLLPISMHVVSASLDPKTRSEHSFLSDETLLLWLTTLRFMEAYSECIGTLFPAVVALLEVDFEHLRYVRAVTRRIMYRYVVYCKLADILPYLSSLKCCTLGWR